MATGQADTAVAPLRILLVLPNFPPMVGGAQRWGGEVARQLHALGHAVEVVAPVKPGWAEHDAGLPFPVRRCRIFGDAMAFSAIGTIRRAARDFRPDAILAGHWSGAHAALRAVGKRIPVVCAVHGREIGLRPAAHFPPAQWVYDRVRAHAFRNAAAFACVSRYIRGRMHEAGVEEARLRVVNNGVDAARFLAPVDRGFYERLGLAGRRILLTVARLTPLKGIDTVIEALPVMLEAQPSLAYVVIGDGPDRERLEALAERHGVRDRVFLAGELAMDDPDVVDAYQHCDLFIMVSREEPPIAEGFGLVFLEAGAAGRPVVGAWTGGIPDAVDDGETGLLVDARDPGAIAAAVNRILADPDLAARLGRNGRKAAVERRGWDSVARTLSALLRELASGA